MKSGARALGIAESYRNESSTLCGAVVSGNGIVDGMGFTTISVGGHDATDGIIELWESVGRPDVRFVLVSGVALAWYNIVDLERIASSVPVPVLAVTYEESDGLRNAIEGEFEGVAAERRLARIAALPPRRRYDLGQETVYCRTASAAPEEVQSMLQTMTRGGGRPEPVRVARLAARAADRYRDHWSPTGED